MLRFNRFVCGAFVCGMVTVALGGAVKIKDFLPYYVNGETESPEGDGMAILNLTGSGKTEIQIAITDFEPFTYYGVWIQSDLGTRILADVIYTNENGNGHFHYSQQVDLTRNPRITIYREFDGYPDSVADEEIRATGS